MIKKLMRTQKIGVASYAGENPITAYEVCKVGSYFALCVLKTKHVAVFSTCGISDLLSTQRSESLVLS